MNQRVLFSIVVLLGLTGHAVQAADKTILVFDASGSRWEQTELRLPATAGAYRLHWKNEQGQLLAEAPITVTEATFNGALNCIAKLGLA